MTAKKTPAKKAEFSISLALDNSPACRRAFAICERSLQQRQASLQIERQISRADVVKHGLLVGAEKLEAEGITVHEPGTEKPAPAPTPEAGKPADSQGRDGTGA